MALDPRLILSGVQAGIQNAQPVTNLLTGVQQQQQLAGEDQRQRLLEQQAEQQAATAEQQALLAPLQRQAMEQKLAIGQAELDSLGVPDEPTAKQLAFNAAKLSALPTPEAKLAEIGRLKLAASQAGRTTQNLDELEAAYIRSPEEGDQLLGAGLQAFERSGLLSPVEKGQAISAGQAEFENLIADFSPEDQKKARRIKAGLSPRATGSAAITTATTEGLAEKVAESEATIKQSTKFAEMSGASRAKVIDEGFDAVAKVDKNLRNIDRAIKAIDEGASTGAIESRFFPTLTKATAELEQVQKELGLDVIGSTTFGALSESELDLALKTALPTNLEPQALREFLLDRKEAQTRYKVALDEQMAFLNDGGTLAEWRAEVNSKSLSTDFDLEYDPATGTFK